MIPHPEVALTLGLLLTEILEKLRQYFLVLLDLYAFLLLVDYWASSHYILLCFCPIRFVKIEKFFTTFLLYVILFKFGRLTDEINLNNSCIAD